MKKGIIITESNLSDIFINPNNVICRQVVLFGQPKYTMIDVKPTFMEEDYEDKQLVDECQIAWHNQTLEEVR